CAGSRPPPPPRAAARTAMTTTGTSTDGRWLEPPIAPPVLGVVRRGPVRIPYPRPGSRQPTGSSARNVRATPPPPVRRARRRRVERRLRPCAGHCRRDGTGDEWMV